MRIRRFFRFFMYFIAAFLLLWIVVMQSGIIKMRTSDSDWVKKLQQKGQFAQVQFADIPNGRGRNLHAVCIHQSDTLPWVLCVHGSPGSSDAYLDYLADTALTRKFNLITYDRAGFGFSGYGQAETSLQSQAADSKAVADFFAPGQAMILLGHSLGGPIICRFAMDYPDQTRALVDVAGSIDPRLEPHQWWVPVVDNIPVKWLLPRFLWVSNHEIRWVSRELEQMMPKWEAIRCPVRFIHAEDDQLVPIGNVQFGVKMLVNANSVKEIILPKGDHFILWSRMDVVKLALDEFAKP